MDFEVKHLICAGLDVHKKTIVAAVCMTDPVTLEAAYKVKSFSTNNSQIAAMRDWLLSYNCHDVCMESTGKYAYARGSYTPQICQSHKRQKNG